MSRSHLPMSSIKQIFDTFEAAYIYKVMQDGELTYEEMQTTLKAVSEYVEIRLQKSKEKLWND